MIAIREPYFRNKLRRRRRSRLPVLLALGLAVLVGEKLYGRYEQYRFKVRREVAQKQIESEIRIRYYLKNETLTFGANGAVEMEKVVFDWFDNREQNQALSFQSVVRSLDPKLPSYKQVQNIQNTINSSLGQFPGLGLQKQVRHINMSVVEGNEVDLEIELGQSSTTRTQASPLHRCLKMNRKMKQKNQPMQKSDQNQIARTRFICESG